MTTRGRSANSWQRLVLSADATGKGDPSHGGRRADPTEYQLAGTIPLHQPFSCLPRRDSPVQAGARVRAAAFRLRRRAFARFDLAGQFLSDLQRDRQLRGISLVTRSEQI